MEPASSAISRECSRPCRLLQHWRNRELFGIFHESSRSTSGSWSTGFWLWSLSTTISFRHDQRLDPVWVEPLLERAKAKRKAYCETCQWCYTSKCKDDSDGITRTITAFNRCLTKGHQEQALGPDTACITRYLEGRFKDVTGFRT